LEVDMYVVVRRWTGAAALIDAMIQKEASLREVIGSVPGFVAYYAARSGDTAISITVVADQAGTEESTRRARSWVQENVPGLSLSPAEVNAGDVFIHIGA
jgi:hypothetical protein